MLLQSILKEAVTIIQAVTTDDHVFVRVRLMAHPVRIVFTFIQDEQQHTVRMILPDDAPIPCAEQIKMILDKFGLDEYKFMVTGL